jgi:hypothetical protein
MTNEKNVGNEQPIRKRVKVFKDKRKYDRYRDRKNKKVYEDDIALNEMPNETSTGGNYEH